MIESASEERMLTFQLEMRGDSVTAMIFLFIEFYS